MKRRIAPAVGLALAGVLLAALLLAPAVTSGFCSDATTSAATHCGTTQQSLVGLPAHWLTWLIGTVVAALGGWRLAPRR